MILTSCKGRAGLVGFAAFIRFCGRLGHFREYSWQGPVRRRLGPVSGSGNFRVVDYQTSGHIIQRLGSIWPDAAKSRRFVRSEQAMKSKWGFENLSWWGLAILNRRQYRERSCNFSGTFVLFVNFCVD